MQLIANNLAAKRCGEIIVRNVSFSLGRGDALIITGPNGAGKSTLLRVIAGLLPSAGGVVRLDGAGEDDGLAASSHYLGHDNAMKPALTVSENLVCWRRFLEEPHLSVDEALETVGLEAARNLPFGYLSAGQRRRVALCRLLVSYRPVWLLDEPTTGLDADSEAGLAALMTAHLEEDGIICAATHRPLGLDRAKELDLELRH